MNTDCGLDGRVISILSFLIQIIMPGSCNRMPLFLRNTHKMNYNEKEGKATVAQG